MNKKFLIYTLTVLSFYALFALSSATILADGAAYVPSDDYPSIQSAISDPDVSTIMVYPGEYHESLTIDSAYLYVRKSIALLSVSGDPEDTKIVATGDYAVHIEMPNIKISGFTIEGPIGIRVKHELAWYNEGIPHNITIENNVISGTNHGIIIWDGNNTKIVNNVIANSGNGITFGEIFNSYTPQLFNVSNNKISDCTGDGIHLRAPNGLITKNIIESCGNAGIYGEIFGDYNTISYNTVTKCKFGIVYDGGYPKITWNDLIDNNKNAVQNVRPGELDAWDYNLYSDYDGYDTNGDGYGEVPYILIDVVNPVVDHHPRTSNSGSPGSGINFAIIPISLTDKPITKNLAYYNRIASEIAAYYKEVSYGTLNINVEVIQKDGGWSSINKASNQYNANTRIDFINDLIKSVDSYIDFTKYDYDPYNGKGVVAFITNSDPFAKGSWIYVGYSSVGMFQTADNVTVDAAFSYEQRFEPAGASNVIRGLAHEYAHAVGKLLITSVQNSSKYASWLLPDEYLMGNVQIHQSLMGKMTDYSIESVHPDGFIKEWLGLLNYHEISVNTTFSITPLSKLGLGSTLYRYSFNAPNLLGPNYFLLEARTPTPTYESQVEYLNQQTFLAVYLVETHLDNKQTIDLIAMFSTPASYNMPMQNAKFIVQSISADEVVVRLEKTVSAGMVGAVVQPAAVPAGAVQNAVAHEIEHPITLPDIDLHAYAEDGKGHVGINYLTGIYENTISGALASGDLFNGNEWIYVPKDTKVKFSVSSKDTAKFMTEFSSAKTYTNGTDSYSIKIVYVDDKGVEISKTSSESLNAGAASDLTYTLTTGGDGKTSISTNLKSSSVKDILDASTQLGGIKITIKDASGNPVSGVNLTSTSQPSGQSALSGVSGSDGTITFSNLLLGSYSMQASKTGYATSSGQGTVLGGSTVTVNFLIQAQTSGGGIPGYPIESIMIAMIISSIIIIYDKKTFFTTIE